MTRNNGHQLPEDVKPEWLAVIRRLQSVCNQDTLTLINITVMVDQDGKPMFWLEPHVRKIEPRKSAPEILAFLAKNNV